MIKKFLLAIISYFIFLTPIPATNAGNFGIVAVVNGEAITNLSLEDRIDLILSSSKLPNNQELREKLSPQALNMLINEVLQRQEAEELGISVTDADMKNAVADLEAKNNVPSGQFSGFLKSEGIAEKDLLAQLKSQILWRKIISRKVTPKIYVSDFEVNEELAKRKNIKSNSEVNLSFIYLPFSDNAKEKEVKALAEKLVDEINSGADFNAVAQQFSQQAGTDSGGSIGWISEENLDKSIVKTIQNTNVGAITGAIKSGDGYRIFYVADRRSSAVAKKSDNVRSDIMLQKIDLEARKYMKSLYNKAFIEIK